MEEVYSALFLALGVLGPIAAFVRRARQAPVSVPGLLAAPALAGLAVGLLFWLMTVSRDWRLVAELALYPWILVFASWGAAIGVAGVLARLLGGWRPWQ
jgi:hypothetical protein